MVEYIICFDLIMDEFKLLDTPNDRVFYHELVRRRFMVVRESLAMMISIENSFRDTEKWVLMNKSSGVQMDYFWIKKFTVKPFSEEIIPLGMWKDDTMLIIVLQN